MLFNNKIIRFIFIIKIFITINRNINYKIFQKQ